MASPSKKQTSGFLPPPVAGAKRPAPSLLPPFEPLSSSPGLPRPIKRARAGEDSHTKYPTPVPTSSTGILSSSPPRLGSRPALTRTDSIISDKRAPLASVPSIELSENGDTITMGRSSTSCHHQLSANRLISRVHVKARYIPPASLEPPKIEVICTGWNGIKLHCQGRTWDLGKGDTFTSETEHAEVMIDVQDARVRLHWPRSPRAQSVANLSDSSWDDSPRSHRRQNSITHHSPLRRRADRIASPESPTPMSNSNSFGSNNFNLGDPSDNIQIYEDASEPELPVLPRDELLDPNASIATIPVDQSFSSELSNLDDDGLENDPDEENDPIVHSFGPFGVNLTGRLAGVSTNSPKIPSPTRGVAGPRAPLASLSSARALSSLARDKESVVKAAAVGTGLGIAEAEASTEKSGSETPQPVEESEHEQEQELDLKPTYNREAITNHVVNQLAFSRLSSSPLSLMFNNLPPEERSTITKEQLRALLTTMACVGLIERTGKDAAGKALESEFYYIPEKDTDASRRAAVVEGLGRPSLRACRKQHKQYYWKRPKTP